MEKEQYFCAKCDRYVSEKEVGLGIVNRKEIFETPTPDGEISRSAGWIHKECGNDILKRDYI